MKTSHIGATVFVAAYVFISGCSYKVQPLSTRAANNYSAYDDKIPGNYALVMDQSMRNVDREIKPVTFICQGHSYPIIIGDSLTVSVKQTLASVFESPVVEQATVPSSDSMKKLGMTGVILVKLDHFFAAHRVCSRFLDRNMYWQH